MICKSQRMDLGECPQIHDLALRADYEAAQKKKDHFYDIDVSSIFFCYQIFKLNRKFTFTYAV